MNKALLLTQPEAHGFVGFRRLSETLVSKSRSKTGIVQHGTAGEKPDQVFLVGQGLAQGSASQACTSGSASTAKAPLSTGKQLRLNACP